MARSVLGATPMRYWTWILVAGLALGSTGCTRGREGGDDDDDAAGGDGDGDVDGDGDGDGDTDADVDADSDTDSDTDVDGDDDADADTDVDADGDTDVDADADVDPGDPACDPLDPRVVDARVGVQPDDGPGELVDLIYSATSTIDVAIYLIGDNNDIFDALQEMAGEVDVRVIVDSGETFSDTQDTLEAAGALTKVQPDVFGDDGDEFPGPFYHIKLVVVDGARTWFSNGNMLEPYMSTERNFEVFDDDPQDAEDLQEVFDADWERRSADLDCARIVVSPESSRDRLLDLIDGATQTLVFETMQFKDAEIRDAVEARADAGVDVRVLLANPEWIYDNDDAATFLSGIGAQARWYQNWDLHAKMILVDGERAYVGSQNFTWTSIERNREVGAFLTESDAIDVISRTFENDWDDGEAF